jgi:hypothetical protein
MAKWGDVPVEGKMDILKTDRKKMLILLSTLSVAAILGTMALTSFFTNAADNITTTQNTLMGSFNGNMRMMGRGGLGRGGCFNSVEVSEEYKQKVIDIANSDSDVQKLLDEGYNITVVNPNIKWKVDSDGNVAAKATSATLVLRKGTTGRAIIQVDIELAKVTNIVISSRTVIDKTSG